MNVLTSSTPTGVASAVLMGCRHQKKVALGAGWILDVTNDRYNKEGEVCIEFLRHQPSLGATTVAVMTHTCGVTTSQKGITHNSQGFSREGCSHTWEEGSISCFNTSHLWNLIYLKFTHKKKYEIPIYKNVISQVRKSKKQNMSYLFVKT